MPPRPGLSEAETEIARMVRELRNARVRQVFETQPAGRNIDQLRKSLDRRESQTGDQK